MMKIGLTSKEIEKTTTTDQVDWQRELCWQIAKLREELQLAYTQAQIES